MTNNRPRPPRVRGLRHFLAAFGYSVSGLRRLWGEAAFRQEILMGIAVVILLAFLKATAVEYMVFGLLFLVLAAVEALNTAIEVLVDHLSPEWSEFARDAKDMGSFAVMCCLLAHGIFAGYVIVDRLLATGA